jgi:tRNA threonylcarbamoyl adenosine modification protein (Sua5/YciO/YrdC/YwlC family)
MKLKIFSKSPAARHITILADILRDGGLVIIPTDSVYAIACAADQPKAIKKMAELKKTTVDKSNFSFLFSDLGMASGYTKPINKDHYKVMNRVLPGPFTFIVPCSSTVEKIFPGRKTVGVRIPDHMIPLSIIKELGIPLITTSVHDDDEILDYTTDPELITRNWEGKVDMIVDGGFGNNEPSTVLECTDEGITMTRQGIGEMDEVIA